MPGTIVNTGRLAWSAGIGFGCLAAVQAVFAAAAPVSALHVLDIAAIAAASAVLAYIGVTANRAAAKPGAPPAVRAAVSYRELLTPLASRGKFEDITAECLRTGRKCAMFLIDVDNFGRINDEHGFRAGDALLLQVGERLRRATPGAEAVSHLFADKFGVLVCGLPEPGDAEALALQLSRAFQEPLFHDDISLRISISIGIAEAPADGTDVSVLMQAANEALRIARAGGGAAWRTFNPAMLHNNRALRRALPDAIVNREIVPYYQPIVDLQSGFVVGLEVLARWKHPTRGLVSPDIFIPVADEAGILSDITACLLREVAHDARAWPEALYFAINVAPNQLRDVTEFAAATQAAPSLPFHRVEIELTETDSITDLEATRESVALLHDRGARVVLDDFGSGHGNFHHLRSIPFDGIKIDRAFALDILTDHRAEACIRSIVQAAVSLNIEVTAEGVSTSEISARVIELGCHFGQGSLYAMPVPANAVPAILSRLGTAKPATHVRTGQSR